MSEFKLKPCPFCGEKDKLRIGHNSWVSPNECYSGYVYCDKCSASISVIRRNTLEEAEADAVKIWNTRVDEDKTEEN